MPSAALPPAPRVIFLPHYGDENPYLRLLASSLEACGATVAVARRRGRRPLRHAIREHGTPDVFHLHWQHRFFVPRSRGPLRALSSTLLFFTDLIALRRAGVRFVWTVHNIVNHERRYERWERTACRLLARLVDRLIVHCDAVVPQVAEAYRIPADRIRVAPHGHYADWYPAGPGREEARAQLGLPGDARIFLFFGQIREYKGVDRLLRDFAGLDDDRAWLVVAGRPRTPELRRSLRALADRDRRVTMELQFIEEVRLIAYLAAADCVVLPFTDSLTSGSAILAASHGRPVIAPALGCTSEFPADAGILYDPASDAGLARALQAALDAPLEEMGAAACAHVRAFDWSDIARATLAIYQDARSGSPSAPDRQASAPVSLSS